LTSQLWVGDPGRSSYALIAERNELRAAPALEWLGFVVMHRGSFLTDVSPDASRARAPELKPGSR
jgi:hypothetical protein